MPAIPRQSYILNLIPSDVDLMMLCSGYNVMLEKRAIKDIATKLLRIPEVMSWLDHFSEPPFNQTSQHELNTRAIGSLVCYDSPRFIYLHS